MRPYSLVTVSLPDLQRRVQSASRVVEQTPLENGFVLVNRDIQLYYRHFPTSLMAGVVFPQGTYAFSLVGAYTGNTTTVEGIVLSSVAPATTQVAEKIRRKDARSDAEHSLFLTMDAIVASAQERYAFAAFVTLWEASQRPARPGSGRFP